jgi:hypothetical protein
VVNDLAQRASSFRSNQGKFSFLEKLDIPICQTEQSGFWLMCSAIICSTEPSSAKSDGLISEIGGSRISRTSNELSETTTGPDDWRTTPVRYLENPNHIAEREI